MQFLSALILALSMFPGHGNALRCYSCTGHKCTPTRMKEVNCGEDQVCMTVSTWGSHDEVTFEHSCVPSETCTNISFDLGSNKKVISCCNRDLCNTRPDNQKNSQMCFGCLQVLNDFKCNKSGQVQCWGSQTKCGRLEHVVRNAGRNLTIDFQGCLSESICHLNSTQAMFGVELGKSFECCDGNLCNGVVRTEMGALCFLIVSLYLLLIRHD
ncbi:prostate stem cell antigen isoform X2 [Stegostoma tigrinum]|uniref:prostate stem cell antigen isoform X2 n=1 Tax=Stegostoma tigrinum TaxID=3053191 RepID=UPI0028706205|nr:prostate stem cell antigen isoform X2 [Stegostoma tigrinum]